MVSGFDLTFQKRFVSFRNENKSKTNLNCHSPWLRDEENYN